MNYSTYTETDLLRQLTETLGALPDITLENPEAINPQLTRTVGYEVALSVQIAGRPVTLLIVARQTAYPRDANNVIWQLLAASRGELINGRNKTNRALSDSATTKILSRSDGTPPDIATNPSHNISDKASPHPVPMLIAQSISVGARQLLREQQVSYFDCSGSLFIQAPGTYIFLDKPAPKGARPSTISLFTGKRASVVHALLMNHKRWFGGTDLSRLTMASTATVSQVLQELERLGWVQTQGQGPAKQRQLTEPGSLLDAWAKQVVNSSPPSMRRYYVPGLRPDGLLEGITQYLNAHEINYAVTHEVAAQWLAPHLTALSQVRIKAAHSQATEKALRETGAYPVSEGANLTVIEAITPTELECRQQVDGIWLASPIQIYLDLMRSEGRAQELAAHFRQERIGF